MRRLVFAVLVLASLWFLVSEATIDALDSPISPLPTPTMTPTDEFTPTPRALPTPTDTPEPTPAPTPFRLYFPWMR